MTSGLDHDARVEQRGKLRDQSRGPYVADRHLRSTRLEKTRGRNAALAEANYEYTLVLEFHRSFATLPLVYRSFSVVSANRAKTSAIIQKRAMTLDSDQPPSSK